MLKFIDSYLKRLILASGFIFCFASQAYPCSSCGSGAADPVILNPLEDQKFYLGFGGQSNFKDIDSRGEVRRDLGPEQKRQLELGFAQRLSENVMGSLVSGVGRNTRGSRGGTGVLDTSLNGRYTALNQTLLEPYLPQIQLVLSHRFKTTVSVQDARKENYLDSFGSGYAETFYGVDAWFGMLPIMFGGSVLMSHPWATPTKSGRLLPGAVQKEILSLGSMLLPTVKVMGGMVRERRAAIRLEGSELSDSDRVSHDLFFTVETLRQSLDNFRFTVSKRASFGENQNATQVLSVTTAWMRTL